VATIEVTRAAAVPRPPRSMAWILLLATAGAVLTTGLVATVVIVSGRTAGSFAVPTGFWPGLLVASTLTVAGLGLRSLRWIFLLRRAETRIPIRDAYIGYFAGFALLLAPLFLGEIALRAWVLRQRGGVPTGVTAVVTLWERGLDLLALLTIGGLLWLGAGVAGLGLACLLTVVVCAVAAPVRDLLLRAAIGLVNRVGRMAGTRAVPPLRTLAQERTFGVALLTSVAAWALPSAALWILAAQLDHAMPVGQALSMFVSSTLVAGVSGAPGGVVVSGGRLLVGLDGAGIAPGAAALIVLGTRLATTGVSTVFGLVFLLVHVRSRAAQSDRQTPDHFDDIADAYDVQIPEVRRLALLARKTNMMDECLTRLGIGRRGLDLGCGQGWYVRRMRELGFDVTGIDTSAGQVALAAQHLGDPRLVSVGSALEIPLPDASVDFVYTINVLHHLPAVEAQRLAFAEILRVLRPGGVLFLHEINTTNPLFRFYMGYVFPSLNCIDEGIERWLLPRELATYTRAPVIEARYFTFLPDFLPDAFIRVLGPVERWLERSSLREYSAHYMAVLRKPA
jgi:SAM-dependent methyltransferase